MSRRAAFLLTPLLACAPPAFERGANGCYPSWQAGVPDQVSSNCRYLASCGVTEDGYDLCTAAAGKRYTFEATCFDGCILGDCVDAWTAAAERCESAGVGADDPEVRDMLAACDGLYVGPPCLAR
ncbi:MAG: hypothetical protein Q8P18_03760 [Pseudomonadota bacterium]|nr:hypothetical protein [Pseudomonadota bacterium]